MGEPVLKKDSSPYKQLSKLINQLSYRHATWQVFSDFLEVSALAVSNSVDWNQREQREKQYQEVIKKYDQNELPVFPELFATLVDALEEELQTNGPGDVLGRLYHDLELHNKYKGQFFTPDNICRMMGDMSLASGSAEKVITKNGYITVGEPACGSGAMVLGLADAMRKRGMNYCSQMVVTATDIDLKCVHMAYLQLSLYGIPAVVIHGNTLTVEEWSRWYTPVYVVDGWIRRQHCGMTDRTRPIESVEEIQQVEPLVAASSSQKTVDIKIDPVVYEQISLFDEAS